MSIRKLNKFSQSLDNKDFTISSEILLRPDTGREAIKIQAELLKEHVDGILVTDNQSGQLHMATLSAGIILKENGIDPIINLTCRNRNRISLTSELLGCASLDMNNLLLTRGEKIPNEIKRKAAALTEMNATELISLANKIKTDEKLPTNNDFLIGGVVTPFTAKPGWPATNLSEKIDAGAQFMITHTCLDMDVIKCVIYFDFKASIIVYAISGWPFISTTFFLFIDFEPPLAGITPSIFGFLFFLFTVFTIN